MVAPAQAPWLFLGTRVGAAGSGMWCVRCSRLVQHVPSSMGAARRAVASRGLGSSCPYKRPLQVTGGH